MLFNKVPSNLLVYTNQFDSSSIGSTVSNCKYVPITCPDILQVDFFVLVAKILDLCERAQGSTFEGEKMQQVIRDRVSNASFGYTLLSCANGNEGFRTVDWPRNHIRYRDIQIRFAELRMVELENGIVLKDARIKDLEDKNHTQEEEIRRLRNALKARESDDVTPTGKRRKSVALRTSCSGEENPNSDSRDDNTHSSS